MNDRVMMADANAAINESRRNENRDYNANLVVRFVNTAPSLYKCSAIIALCIFRSILFGKDIGLNNAQLLAQKGDGRGFYALSLIYAKGSEVKFDGGQSYSYLKKAVDAGNSDAQLLYALIREGYSNKNGIPRIEDTIRERIERYTKISAGRFINNSLTPFSFEDEKLISEVTECYKKSAKGGNRNAEGELVRFETKCKQYNESKKKTKESSVADSYGSMVQNNNRSSAKSSSVSFESWLGIPFNKSLNTSELSPSTNRRCAGMHYTFHPQKKFRDFNYYGSSKFFVERGAC